MDIDFITKVSQLIYTWVLIFIGASAIGGAVKLYFWYRKNLKELDKIEAKILELQEHYIAIDKRYPHAGAFAISVEHAKLQREDLQKERDQELNFLREKRQHIIDRMSILHFLRGS